MGVKGEGTRGGGEGVLQGIGLPDSKPTPHPTTPLPLRRPSRDSSSVLHLREAERPTGKTKATQQEAPPPGPGVLSADTNACARGTETATPRDVTRQRVPGRSQRAQGIILGKAAAISSRCLAARVAAWMHPPP